MRLSLSKKITAVALLTLSLTLSTMLTIMLAAEQKREMRSAMENAQNSSRMIVEALVFAMREGVTDVTPFEEQAATIGAIRELRVIPTEQIDRVAAATMDAFERSTFATNQTVSGIETFNGESVLRIATPILSDQSCVDCHGGSVGDPITVISMRTSLEEALTSVAAQRYRAILMGIGTLLLTVLILFLLVNKWIVSALRACVTYASRLAQGDLRDTLLLTNHDETGQLADSFNLLRDSLHAKEVASQHIAAGNLEEEPPVASDMDSLGFAMRDIVASLRTMRQDLTSTTHRLKQGELDARCDNSHLQGSYAELVEGVNQAIEAVVQPMLTALDCIGTYAAGDLECEMPALPGQQRMITDGLNTIRTNLRELVDEAGRLTRAAEEGQLGIRAETGRLKGAFREVIEGMNRTLDHLLAPTVEAAGVIESMATGDLTRSVEGDYKGDHALTKLTLNNLANNLNHLLGDISEAVEQVRTGSDQVASTSQSLSDGATRQAASLEEISSSMQEVEQRANLNGKYADEAQTLSDDVRHNAEVGNARMARMLEAMDSINQAAGKISKIIKTIDEIAFQTNLLALNAAVEAARAGVHGKGFAIVAQEVRSLAQRSAKAAAETTQLIEDSISRAKNGSHIATETAESLGTIIGGVDKVRSVIGEIADAVSYQNDAIRGINTGLAEIDQVTQANSAIAEESAASAEELSGQSATLHSMLQEFTLRRANSRAPKRLQGRQEKDQPRRLSGEALTIELDGFDDFDASWDSIST